MIKKVKSTLALKVFVITALLMTACCFLVYFFIINFAPYVYTYALSEVEQLGYELSQELSMTYREDASAYFKYASEMILERYDNEFDIHLFQNSGEELKLPYLDGYKDRSIIDYHNVETTTPYTITFADSSDGFLLFLTKNSDKESQVVEALYKVLPIISVVIPMISIMIAFFYSRYITAPITKLSKISKKMADMDFRELSNLRRTDEIGILSSSLNQLSENLTVTLARLQEANKTLQSDIDKERQLERQRLDFFSAASHELKTPITIIKGQLQGMLCNVGRYKDRETYLAQTIQVTTTLEQMVQELLIISRLDSPGYSCNMNYFNFSELINDRLTAYEDFLIQREMKMSKSISPKTYLNGDAQLLQKVIDNLLSNAISYSPQGNEIFVKLWTKDDCVQLTIENTGVFIPVEAISKLFEAFYRVDQSRNRLTGGSGLGLYIVKSILDLHDAKIEITNSSHGVIVTIQF